MAIPLGRGPRRGRRGDGEKAVAAAVEQHVVSPSARRAASTCRRSVPRVRLPGMVLGHFQTTVTSARAVPARSGPATRNGAGRDLCRRRTPAEQHARGQSDQAILLIALWIQATVAAPCGSRYAIASQSPAPTTRVPLISIGALKAPPLPVRRLLTRTALFLRSKPASLQRPPRRRRRR